MRVKVEPQHYRQGCLLEWSVTGHWQLSSGDQRLAISSSILAHVARNEELSDEALSVVVCVAFCRTAM